jgi:shikimate dehydrogenase
MTISGATVVAGVVGAPVRHSLSPLIQNAWIEAAGVDGVYVALSPSPDRFPALLEGLRGGALRGLNVTLPFKEHALAAADHASERARRAGAANLLLFEPDGAIRADNTDGEGLLAALAKRAPALNVGARPVVVLGAGGAARGAVAALLDAGAPEVRIVNRTLERAHALADELGARVTVHEWGGLREAMTTASAVINATSLGLAGKDPLAVSFDGLQSGAVVMDMVYRPLRTAFLARAASEGFVTVDGLAMLIGQARPSFEAFFGRAPPANVDVRRLALAVLGEAT